ncbi:protein of unknown function [Kyrpidia spormannii]|uniref:Uncharacterized protein n=2 Tax=Kyrpidia spormannii TaxID=2055160 RepID=A0ACA8Z4U3_9BACL|nr:protein of unknown function [Kyrpidia spormannii]CAB3390274.1 protein of unknown function [Kyrpidia spormannii]
MTSTGKLRYFLLDGRGFGEGRQSAVTEWITTHCKLVPGSEWGASASSPASAGTNMRPGGVELYEYVGP